MTEEKKNATDRDPIVAGVKLWANANATHGVIQVYSPAEGDIKGEGPIIMSQLAMPPEGLRELATELNQLADYLEDDGTPAVVEMEVEGNA